MAKHKMSFIDKTKHNYMIQFPNEDSILAYGLIEQLFKNRNMSLLIGYKTEDNQAETNYVINAVPDHDSFTMVMRPMAHSIVSLLNEENFNLLLHDALSADDRFAVVQTGFVGVNE